MLTIMLRCQAATAKHMIALIARLESRRERTSLPNQIKSVDSLLPRTVRCLYNPTLFQSSASTYRVSAHVVLFHALFPAAITPFSVTFRFTPPRYSWERATAMIRPKSTPPFTSPCRGHLPWHLTHSDTIEQDAELVIDVASSM